MVLGECAVRLHEAGLLSELMSGKVRRYLRSAKAMADLESFTQLASTWTKAEQNRLALQGLPPSDYLNKGEKVSVPMVA